MPKFLNFAGRDTELLDGNLGGATPLDLVSTLIIGTAPEGPSGELYTIASKTNAKNKFGYDTSATLLQGAYEAFDGGAPQVKLFRIGGTPALRETMGGTGGAAGPLYVQTKICKESASLDYKLALQENDDSEYIFYVWRVDTSTSGTLIYRANVSGTVPVPDIDLNEVIVWMDGVLPASPTEFGGLTFATAVYMMADGDLPVGTTGGWTVVGSSLTEGTAGLDMTRQQTYEALHEAYKVLEDYSLHFIVPMDVYLDDYNVADVPAGSDPGSETYYGTEDYLRYAYVVEGSDGVDDFTWADTKVTTDYHEVNFAYQLANFCFQMTRNEMMVHGIIGVRPPNGFAPSAINTWIGVAPTISELDDTLVTVNGSGLLGNKFMAGTTSWDAGFWATEDEWLDTADILEDPNGIQVDIGRHLSVFVNWLSFSNSYLRMLAPRQSSYVTSGAPTYAGFLASLPPNQAPSYKVMQTNFTVPYNIAKSKLNSLAGSHYIVLRPTAAGWRIADGWTAARNTSDYRRFSTFAIIKYCDREIRTILDDYIGVGMTLQLRESLKARLDSRFKEIIKEGYLQRFNFNVTASALAAANGYLYIFADLVPAFEVRRISLTISVLQQ